MVYSGLCSIHNIVITQYISLLVPSFMVNTFVFAVPSTAPSILSADRTNGMTVEIQWELLSLKQLRGNLSSYEIVYHELEEDCPLPNVNSSNQSSVSVVKREPVFSITDLDPRREYCIGIAARTGAGIGEFSFKPVSCELASTYVRIISLYEHVLHMFCRA